MSKTTKTIIWLIVAIVVIAGIWWGVTRKPAQPPTTEKEVIKIGATLPLTGSLSYKGSYELKGMKMAVDEINATGGINGKKLILVVEDNKGDPKQAVTGVQKLIDVDNVLAILSAFTHISSAIVPVIEERNNVLIYESTVSSLAESSDNVFKDYYSMKDVGEAFAQAAYREKVKNIGLLYPISEWGNDFKTGFEEKAKELGINILIEEPFDFGATDLRTEILKIKEKGVDGIASTGLEKHTLLMLKSINDLNLLDKKLFMLELLTKNIKESSVSMHVIKETNAISSWYYFDPSSSDQRVRNFVKNYKKRYNEEPTADAVYFYDDIYVLSDVLKICDKKKQLTSSCIITELKRIKNYNGIAGPMNFDKKGVCNRPIKLFQFIDDGWVPYEL